MVCTQVTISQARVCPQILRGCARIVPQGYPASVACVNELPNVGIVDAEQPSSA